MTPNGSQIIPHNKSEKILSAANGTNINLNLTIQGNVMETKPMQDYLGGFISKRINKQLSIIFKENKMDIIFSANNNEEMIFRLFLLILK